MTKAKSVFFCTECGNETPKWAGRCPSCGAWNTLVEQAVGDGAKAKTGGRSRALRAKAHPIAELDTAQEIRFPTGMGELDRVLGGGAVQGSLVLVGGAPGIGPPIWAFRCRTPCRKKHFLPLSYCKPLLLYCYCCKRPDAITTANLCWY